MSLVIDAEYKRALGVAIATLVAKQMITHVLTVRCRLNTSKMNVQTTPESAPSTWDLPVFGLLKLSLLADVGPMRGENDLEVRRRRRELQSSWVRS